MDQLLQDNGKRFWMADEGNKIRNISVGRLGSEYFQGRTPRTLQLQTCTAVSINAGVKPTTKCALSLGALNPSGA